MANAIATSRRSKFASPEERQGSGLGLAIVKSIVELHGGEVRAVSHAGLTSFTIEFPARLDGPAAVGSTQPSAA